MKKVLVVEDDKPTLYLLKKIINDIGYVDILATSAELATEILKVNPDIDLVITDVSLEEKSGLSLLIDIRKSKTYAKIPVIICSGTVKKDDVFKFLKEGASLFIEKPINTKKMQAHIIKLLDYDLVKS